jgi:hypothetical protein
VIDSPDGHSADQGFWAAAASIASTVNAVADFLGLHERDPEAKGMSNIHHRLVQAIASQDAASFEAIALHARSLAYGMGGLFDVYLPPRPGDEHATEELDALVNAMVRSVDMIR